MRIGDWSSDVCSSDLGKGQAVARQSDFVLCPAVEKIENRPRQSSSGVLPKVGNVDAASERTTERLRNIISAPPFEIAARHQTTRFGRSLPAPQLPNPSLSY